MNAYKENEYVSPLKIRSYADLKSNLNSHINAAAIDKVTKKKKKKKKKKKHSRIHFRNPTVR